MNNPDIRAAFQSWWHQTHTFGSPATIEDVARRAFEAGIEHAASLSNSVAAGELPPLPEALDCVKAVMRGEPEWMTPCDNYHTDDMMRTYAKKAVDAALAAMSEPTAQDGVAGLRPYEFSTCGKSLRWYLKRDVDAMLAARQPAPALPVKYREIIERAVRYISNSHHTHIARDTMLDELGEVLAATAAPVLSDEQKNAIRFAAEALEGLDYEDTAGDLLAILRSQP